MNSLRVRARAAYAAALVKADHRMANAAANIRDGGYSNVWINAGIDATEAAMRACPDGEEGEDERAAAPHHA